MIPRLPTVYMGARRPYVDPVSRHFLGFMDTLCSRCFALHWMEEKLAASAVANPQFGTCCNSGNVAIQLLPDPPPALRRFYDGSDIQSREFKENMWRYNRAFAFTSFGVTEDHSVNSEQRGPPVFRIQGELFHRMGSLLPFPYLLATVHLWIALCYMTYYCTSSLIINHEVSKARVTASVI